jgi:hypothetical protein
MQVGEKESGHSEIAMKVQDIVYDWLVIEPKRGCFGMKRAGANASAFGWAVNDVASQLQGILTKHPLPILPCSRFSQSTLINSLRSTKLHTPNPPENRTFDTALRQPDLKRPQTQSAADTAERRADRPTRRVEERFAAWQTQRR